MPSTAMLPNPTPTDRNFVLGELLSGFKLFPARRSHTFGGYFVCPETPVPKLLVIGRDLI
jgi:hypothetical protein